MSTPPSTSADRSVRIFVDDELGRRIVDAVDGLLLERGEVEVLECLLRLGLIEAGACAGLRRDPGADPVAALLRPLDQVVAALERVQAYAKDQGLVVCRSGMASGAESAQSPDFDFPSYPATWPGCMLRPAADRVQNDLFRDSAENAALHSIIQALSEHRLEEARAIILRFAHLDLPHRQDYQQLIQAAAPVPASPAERLEQLQAQVEPLALRRLGGRARTYLVPLWSRLAQQLAGLPYSAAAPELHASHAHGRAGQWQEVVHSVEAEPEWSRHVPLLTRLAEAHARQSRFGAARRLWMRLCWDHPGSAPAVLSRAPGDAVVARHWEEFSAAEIEFAAPDFPAWLLLLDRRQRGFVPPELAPDDDCGRAYTLVHRLLASGGAIEARKALHGQRPDLFRLYLAMLQQQP